jgi:hypothetical protein
MDDQLSRWLICTLVERLSDSHGPPHHSQAYSKEIDA